MNINYHPYDKTLTLPVEIADSPENSKGVLTLDFYKTKQGVFANINLTSAQFSIIA